MSLAQLPIGERDRRLLAYFTRASYLGVISRGRCCWTAPIARVACNLISEYSRCHQSRRSTMASNGKLELSAVTMATRVTFHLPNSLDLTASWRSSPASKIRMKLLLEQAGGLRAVERDVAVPAELICRGKLLTALQTQISEVDPQADIQLNFSCQACGRVPGNAGFDIASFLWSRGACLGPAT